MKCASRAKESAPDLLPTVVLACQRGERGAQRQLYETYHRRVYRLMVRMVGEAEAEDMTQQVFLQVLRSIGQFSGRSSIGTWIYRLATNESLQYLRQRRRQAVGRLEDEPADVSAGHAGRTEQKELLERALARLEPELRAAFVLREVEGLSYAQIAEALQIPEGTVASRLSRARRELREHLAQLGWEM